MENSPLYAVSKMTCLGILFAVFTVLTAVAQAEQYFVSQPRNTYVLEGEQATLYCRVANKTGIVFWEKDSTIIAKETVPLPAPSESAPLAIFGDVTKGEYNLQLTRVSRRDEGRYVCRVTYTGAPRASNLTSSAGLLTVLDLPGEDFPMCVMSLRDGLTEGDVVQLTCAYLNNSSRPTLTWERLTTPADLTNSKQVTRDGYFFKRHSMILGVEDDGASYQCIASMSGRPPRSCTTGILSVNHRPVIAISPVILSAKTGGDARLTCSLNSANPRSVTYQWYYRGAAVTLFSTGIDLIETPGGGSQILIDNLQDPTGSISIICEATNDVGSTRVESIISLDGTEVVGVTTQELILWLVPISVLVAILVLSIFLATVVLNCCPCCRTFCNNKGRRRPLSPDRSTWSAAENYGMSPSPVARRLSDADSTDFYLTRAIRTPVSPEGTQAGQHNTSNHSYGQVNHSTPSPNYRNHTPSPNARRDLSDFYNPTPNGRASDYDPRRQEPSRHYEPRRPRNDRTRDHFRRSGQATDTDIRSATRTPARSDSGLDFAVSSSLDSRSPTPREDRVVYAQIRRNRRGDPGARDGPSSASPQEESMSRGLEAGAPLPTSSTSRQPSTLVVPIEGMHRAQSMEIPTS